MRGEKREGAGKKPKPELGPEASNKDKAEKTKWRATERYSVAARVDVEKGAKGKKRDSGGRIEGDKRRRDRARLRVRWKDYRCAIFPKRRSGTDLLLNFATFSRQLFGNWNEVRASSACRREKEGITSEAIACSWTGDVPSWACNSSVALVWAKDEKRRTLFSPSSFLHSPV